MNKLKGFTQLSNRPDYNVPAEFYEIWKWDEKPEDWSYRLTIPNIEEQSSGWQVGEIPGKGHPDFSKFSLWFEYND